MRIFQSLLLLVALSIAAPGCVQYDLIIRGGTIHDGSGAAPRRADVAIRGDKIVAIGDLDHAMASRVIDATGKAVAPGFINMLSWSTVSLIADGNSQGEIRQGVTTQIMGEGHSMGPLNEQMKKRMLAGQGDIQYAIEWTTLTEYLEYLERRGVSQNVASYIGAATIREHVIGLEDRPPTPSQLDMMRALVRQEMEAGALGIGSSLIYAPGSYASTKELIELCKVAAEYDGKYISHLRSEGNTFLEALEELITIAREAKIPAEIYHLKAAGEENWPKLEKAFARIEAARAEGLKITADIYTYTAGATGLNACIPMWAKNGGAEAMRKRFVDPELRKRILKEIVTPTDEWESLYLAAGSPDRVLLTGFKMEKLKPLQGKSLAEVAKLRGKPPEEVILDLMVEDESRVNAVYFLMSEENVQKKLRQPWVSLCSDSASMATEGVFLKSNTHPRAYGSFARLLGKYVREEKVLSLEEAIRRMTGLPATNLGLDRRGFLREEMYADVVVFDPEMVADRATYAKPHQYSVGVEHVIVNGTMVLNDGEHTGAKPGRALWGPGRKRGIAN